MASFLVPSAIAITAEFFPVLATKLGGPRGKKVAEHIVDAAARIAGLPRDADPREIIAALGEDGAKADELRLRLEELDQQEHQRIVEDRADARRYQASIGARARMRGTFMLLGVVAGLIACIAAVLTGTTDPAPLALVTTISGALLKMLSDAFAFEFGSSAGSKEKDAHIENIQRALIDTARARGERDDAAIAAFAPRPAPSAAGPIAGPRALDEPETGETADEPGDQVVKLKITRRDFVAELVQLSA
jgi:hypothetical protein